MFQHRTILPQILRKLLPHVRPQLLDRMRRLREAQLPLLAQQEQGDPDELDRTRSGRFLETPVPSRVLAHQQQSPERREHPLLVRSTDVLVLREERLERSVAGPHPV
jgi:hypothetical protein